MDTNVNVGEGIETRYWRKLTDGRSECLICPRFCKLHEGQRGLCFVRGNSKGKIVLLTYGRSSGFCIDPIEKKPLNHFYPGTPVFSFGTAGCNLACKFCQNWDISKSREMDSLMDYAEPNEIAITAKRMGCKSVAFTYNDPVIFHEYAIDVAKECHGHGLKTVAVSAGYQCPEPREEFYLHMDAANIDLKAFSESFYHNICGGHLQPVLETLEYISKSTSVWLEVTTLLIPGQNDTDAEIMAMTEWFRDHLGSDVPLHFSAFHPDWKMLEIQSTPASTLLRAREIALRSGLKYVYVGNIHDKAADSTYCHLCGQILIGRDWYELSEWNLTPSGRCRRCGTLCAGVFEPQPGHWGAKRLPVELKLSKSS